MPNVETENKNNAPSRKKDKTKSLAVTTEKDVSSLPHETLSPITPAIESGDSNLENVNKNPYIDVIIKKIRKLKKVMRNVEKYEAMQKDQLSDDQIKVLERKGETSGAIKEFEGTLKQIELVEKEELKKQAEQKKAQQAERDKAIADAVEKVKATHCKSLLQLILFFRLVHFQQRSIIQLPDNEFEGVETLRAKLTTLSEEAENDESYEEKIRQVLDLVNKLNSGDDDLILPNGAIETDQVASNDEPPSSYGISYSQLRSLIQNPPIPETTGDQEESNETFEIINTPDHVDVSNEYTSGLQFMRSDDQSQPQPQAFDNTINNATFGYQSTDAEQTPAEETIVEVNVQEQYSQQQNYDTYTVEQQHFNVEQQQYIGEQQQQQFIEQEDQQQVPTEQEELSQQQEEPPVQESQTTSEDQADSKLPQATPQQNSNQPPPLSQGSGGHRGRYNRGNRGHRGQGSRRESGGYNNYGGGGYYRDGNYGSYRGRGGSGPRGGRGGGFQGNRGTPYKQRSQ